MLFALRAEPVRASLEKAIAARENAWYAKYRYQDGVAKQMQAYYQPSPTQPPTTPVSKPDRLDALANISQSQHDALNSVYQKDLPSVVKTTSSSETLYKADGTSVAGVNKTSNTGYDYRYPTYENDAQYQRAQISLIDERFSQFMFQQNLDKLGTVFTNELSSIDFGVRQLQVAYANTILISPISGTVTGIFRDLGDCVKAGQPVLRVDNDKEVLLTGTVRWQGLISINSKVSISTNVSGLASNPQTITGMVVSIRGHDSEDDRWDLLVRCSNRNGTLPIFPLNYNFDFDDTTVSIT